MTPRRPAERTGFTLIEVLVALAIIAVALLAALRTAGLGSTQVGELRAHLLAGWVAEDLLAEQRARGDWPSTGISGGTRRQGGIAFTWRQETLPTPHPDFRRVDVRVYAEPDTARALAHLTGFVVSPAGSTP